MALNKAKQDEIAKRREDVARQRLRGWTQRQIAEFLGVSAATVNLDLAALNEEWRKMALASIEEHKIKLFNELEEVKRAAWANKEYSAVLKAMKQQADLMGLDAPANVDITSKGDKIVSPAIVALPAIAPEDGDAGS